MRHDRLLNTTAWYLSFLLGQASALLGLMITLGWVLSLVLIVPPKGIGAWSGPRMLLPIEPPLIGLLLGAAGLFVARWGRQRIGGYSVAGLILNALPLTLAVLLMVLRWSL